MSPYSPTLNLIQSKIKQKGNFMKKYLQKIIYLYSWGIPYFETKKEAILSIPYFFNDESERAFKTALKEYLH